MAIASQGVLERVGAAPLPRALTAAVLALLGYAAFAGYDWGALGLHPAREEPALFTALHLIRSAFALTFTALIVKALLIDSTRFGLRHRTGLRPWEQVAAALAMTLALAWTLTFAIAPATFHASAMEDTAVEWASALLPLAAGALFLRNLATRLQDRGKGGRVEWLGLALCAGFAFALLLIGLEEISWGQRLFGFATPKEVAAVNWQGEFNLHNMNTDLFEAAYYAGGGLFLLLGPLIAESLAEWPPLEWVADFLPGRLTAATAAPLAIFTYGQWNLIPVQMSSIAAVFALIVFARRSSTGRERLLFAALAACVTAGQAVFLLRGQTQVAIWDASEYKELFIALGMACFAFEVERRRRGRSVLGMSGQ